MKQPIALFVMLVLLAACGEGSKIKDVIRNNLKDPGSANFKDLVVSEDGKRACIVWNAKNSMGGYGDWNIAELKKDGLAANGDKWIVKDMKGLSQNCTEISFRKDDILNKLMVGDTLLKEASTVLEGTK